jgi:glycolate oxidase FAD binding subunit
VSATLAVTDPVLLGFAEEVGAVDPVAVAGGRTRWELGGPLADGTRTVTAPTGIVAYAPEEMTVTVRAGTPVAELHAALAVHDQRTSLPERGGTVGGAVVVGENHLDALGRGRVRDHVLQVRYVSAEGRPVTGGGPTVKNVTGFDLPRLMVGSLGTLGLVAEVILRTNPTPATSRWFVAPDASPRDTYRALLAPSAVLWDGSSTWVHLEGHEPDVRAQRTALGPVGTFTEADGPPALPPHRWSLTPAELSRLDEAVTGTFVAALGLGLVFATEPQPPRPLDAGAAGVARRVKQNFDPTGRLNPGRDPARR